MKKITEFAIEEYDDISSLVSNVNSLIKQGWQPFGALHTEKEYAGYDEYKTVYKIAMVKYAKSPVKSALSSSSSSSDSNGFWSDTDH